MKMVLKSVLKNISISEYNSLKEDVIGPAIEDMGLEKKYVKCKLAYRPRVHNAIVAISYDISKEASPWNFSSSNLREEVYKTLETLAEEICQEGGAYTINGKEGKVSFGRFYASPDGEKRLDRYLESQEYKDDEEYEMSLIEAFGEEY